MIKKCIKCEKEIDGTEEEITALFRKVSGYHRNVCRECENQMHRSKYSEGKWNGRNHGKFREEHYIQPLSMG